MARLREIFANNLKENRKKCGFSQEKLAEMAEVSTHYIAMIELARNFPTSEIIERLAAVLDIEIYELFVVSHSPKEELEKLRRTLVTEIRQMVEEAVETAFAKRDKKPKG
ncbi:DNA-binding protein [Treponema primitia ZAS-2]|uniref:DNA-binding protein n=1 Tax=Treponema primitia (strain ATCC BAA-887 / DSM 12427 / ZAS-2) TaxID=545694 RepID=F5YM00_TREPZ|nr:helix-turn-helix transcriptional regulator [Treponema primitia]AEF85109.1 DNA-binding protein [Treponema primitia ZAS-2]